MVLSGCVNGREIFGGAGDSCGIAGILLFTVEVDCVVDLACARSVLCAADSIMRNELWKLS